MIIDKIKNLTFILNLATEEIKTNLESSNRPTTHYIWRTRGDGKVRLRHARFNGKIFAWDSPPEGGYHPREDYGCRCWAEPYYPKITKEYVKQVLVKAPADATTAWSLIDYLNHYFYADGAPVKLHEMGILRQIISKAKSSIYPKMERRIFEKVKINGAGKYSFRRVDSYSFHFTYFWLYC